MSHTYAVSGTSGFLGKHLVKRLQETAVVIPLKSKYRDFQRVAADTVVLSGGYSPKSSLEFSSEHAAFDLEFVQHLLTTIERPRSGRVYLISSTDVLSSPNSQYSGHKRAIETACLSLCKRQQLTLTIIRLGPLYGPGEEAYNRLIPVYIRARLLGEEVQQKPSPGFGRNFLFVRDAVDVLYKILESKLAIPELILEGGVSSGWKQIKRCVDLAVDEGLVELGHGSSGSSDFEIFETKVNLTAPTDLCTGLREEVSHVRRWLDRNRP